MTHQVEPNLLLTLDIKTKVQSWPVQARLGQAKTELVIGRYGLHPGVRVGADLADPEGHGGAEAAAEGAVGRHHRHDCQMAVDRFLDRMCLALRASGL